MQLDCLTQEIGKNKIGLFVSNSKTFKTIEKKLDRIWTTNMTFLEDCWIFLTQILLPGVFVIFSCTF
jgi:hypothetical protein